MLDHHCPRVMVWWIKEECWVSFGNAGNWRFTSFIRSSALNDEYPPRRISTIHLRSKNKKNGDPVDSLECS
jgi:hypothetical protein